MHRVCGRRGGWVVLMALGLGYVLSAEQAVGDGSETEALRARAERLAASGAWSSAIAAYEDLARQDASQRRVLAPLIVRLALKAGAAGKALPWAKEVAQEHPRPQAYLAGVYAELGQLDEAARLLDEALVSAVSPRERVELLWQTAEVKAKQGRRDDAEAALRQALQEAKGTADEPAAARRLDALGQPPGGSP